MRKKRIPKASKKRLIFFGTVSIIIIIYFFVSLGYYLYGIYSRTQEEAGYKAELSDLKKEEKILTTEIEKLQNEDYIARYAREKYSYSKDGEYILKINNNVDEEKPKNSFILDNYYKYLIGIGLLLIIVIIIRMFKRKKWSYNWSFL